MIEGTSIRLRVWRDDDLPALTTLRNDIALQAQLLARVRGSRPKQVLEWLEQRSTEPNGLLFIIADLHDDATLGFLQISNLDPVDRHADLGICLLNDARGHGRGGEAIALASDHLRDGWELRKLSLRLRADNAAALRCYEKAGFEHCGLLKQHVYIEGRWHDIVLMEHFLVSAN